MGVGLEFFVGYGWVGVGFLGVVVGGIVGVFVGCCVGWRFS